MKHIRTFALLAGAGLTLAACGGKDDTPAPDANVTAITVPETPANVNVSTEEPAPAPSANATHEAAPPPAFSDQEQTQADAAATGMTSRVDRSEGNDSAGQ